jgi:hypothetical protein
MEGSGPAPGNHAESVESRSILGLVSLTTLLRAVWLTEHTRKSEPGLAGVRCTGGGIQAVVKPIWKVGQGRKSEPGLAGVRCTSGGIQAVVK